MTPDRQSRVAVSVGRKIFGCPVLSQDWDDVDQESPARYWELFTDLLMVAAASSIADVLKEDQTTSGLIEFALLYLAVTNGWLLYTHHYTARFVDASLMHFFVLFFWLLGMAASIVNAGYKTARGFSLAIILQRGSFLCMMIPIGIYMIRARPFTQAVVFITALSMLGFIVCAVRPDWDRYAWTAAALVDMNFELFLTQVLPGNKLIPVNIEHSKDRLGVLVLVMLGETVISTTMTYREYAADATNQEGKRYYIVLTLSFLLIFMFTLVFFNMQPPPIHHAFRRSRLIGLTCLVLNKILGLGLLAVGVSIKLAVEAVAEQKNLSPFAGRLLGCAVGFSMLLLFGTRLCHYGGVLPRAHDPPDIQRLMWIWWFFLAVACLVPFLFVSVLEPVVALSLYSGLLMILCVVESWFTDVLQEHLPNEEITPLSREKFQRYDVTETISKV